MNYRQNNKINQITTDTLVIGVDIAKYTHVARAVDERGIELSKKIAFKNTLEGFLAFEKWIYDTKIVHQKSHIVIGMEPTGHYWGNLSHYLLEKEYLLVVVNPMHVKKSKELDDNNPTKTDAKDARIIATLVKDGRFSAHNFPDEIYSDLRNAMNHRTRILKNLQQTKNQIHGWYDRFFPEYHQVFKGCCSQTLLFILSEYGLPQDIAAEDPNTIYENLPQRLRISSGKKKIQALWEQCKKSVGIKSHRFAKTELRNLINTYTFYQKELQEIEEAIESLSTEIEEIQQLQKINGIGLVTACGIIAELGDVRKYKDYRQLYKMAGLSLKEESSGLKKGKTTISRRGRSDLRKTLYQAVFSLIVNNEAFKELHHYYKTRAKNQLCGKASIIALCRKLLRILFTLVHKKVEYDERKMLKDITHPKEFLVAA